MEVQTDWGMRGMVVAPEAHPVATMAMVVGLFVAVAAVLSVVAVVAV